MNPKEYASRCEKLNLRLYRTALSWLGNEADEADALGEAIHKGLKGCGKLRDKNAFESWIMRILINECKNLYRQKKT